MKLLKAFALAWNFLSIFPFFKVHHFFTGINGLSAMLYPFIGFLLGCILWGFHTLLTPYLPSAHLSVILFGLWVLLTGALHLDGLSDSIDGFFVSKDKALHVMKDAHVGGMGMIFSFVFILLKLSSLLYLDLYYLLPIILMFSRLNATLAIYLYPYISDGVALLIQKELSVKHLFFACLYSLIIAFFFDALWMFYLTLGVLFVSAYIFVRRLEGLNGDNYGFIVEMTELALLNAIIVSQFV